MQITFLDIQQAADILETGNVLAQFVGPGTSRTHDLTAIEGRDFTLIICGPTGMQ